MKKSIRKLLLVGAGGAVLLLVSCASISEQDCQAGNWADIGYKDGVKGKSRAKIADYVQTCSEYGAEVDRQTYLESYETGLTYYCTYDNGFERGRNGSSYNTVCDGPDNTMRAADFRAGYDAGYGEYELRQRFTRYETDIDDLQAELQDVKDRLGDPALAADEKKRLHKKKKRLRDELEDLRWNFRDFKRKYDLHWD